MATTTIRLPEDLKAKVTAAAARAGTTAHAYILEAIAEKTSNEERRAELDTEAETRFAQVVASGMTISWNDMRTYLEKRLGGEPAQGPKVRKLSAKPDR